MHILIKCLLLATVLSIPIPIAIGISAEERIVRIGVAPWLFASLLLLSLSVAIFALSLARKNRGLKEALAETERLSLRDVLLERLGEGVYGVNSNGETTFINPEALSLLGFSMDEILGRNQHLLFHHHLPDGREYPLVECPVYQTLTDGKPREGEEWFIRKNGSGFPVWFSVTPIREERKTIGAVVAFQDITERRRTEQELRIAATAFESQEGMIVTDASNVILRVNRAFTALTGYQAGEVVGKTPSLLSSGRHDREFYRIMWETLLRERYWQGEIWNRRKNGEIYPEWLTISAVMGADGIIANYVGAFSDITQHKEAEEQIRTLAFYDPLTKLPNRRLLIDRLHQTLIVSERDRRYGAILFLDLDNFKSLNDTRGHDVGDLLLIEVAERLKSCVRASDTVARLGGDEFVILLQNLGEDESGSFSQAEQIAKKILEALSIPYFLKGMEHHSTASIGIAPFCGKDSTVEELLKRADIAMYQAKDAGGNTIR